MMASKNRRQTVILCIMLRRKGSNQNCHVRNKCHGTINTKPADNSESIYMHLLYFKCLYVWQCMNHLKIPSSCKVLPDAMGWRRIGPTSMLHTRSLSSWKTFLTINTRKIRLGSSIVGIVENSVVIQEMLHYKCKWRNLMGQFWPRPPWSKNWHRGICCLRDTWRRWTSRCVSRKISAVWWLVFVILITATERHSVCFLRTY
jgi:hypothetical protein